MTDTVKQQQLGVALLGTQFEDLGQSGVLAIDLTKTSLKDLGGATDSLNKRYENFGNFFEAMSRQIQLALLPVGKELLSLANDAMPYLQRASTWLGERLPGWIKTGLDAVKAFGTGAINTYNTLRPAIDAVATTFQKTSAFIERNKEVLIPLTAAVGAGAAAFGVYRLGVAAVTLATGLWTAAQTAATAASVALRAALTFITGPVGLVITAITLLVGAGVALYRNWDEVKAFALRTWGQIKEIVSNAIDGAVKFLQGINMKEIGLQIVQGLVNGILAGPALVLRAARGLGSAVISGIKDILAIRSPSVVMFEAGENVGQGLANGITKTTPAVQKAAAQMAYSVTEEVNAARAALEKSISGEQWVASLQNATTAQLKNAQATARAAGDAEKYGAIKNELERREAAHTAAVQKNADAVKAQADELARNRAQIVSGEQHERYVAGLRSATSTQLDSALATARSRGETEKYNAIRSEQARREQEVEEATRKSTDAAKAAADQLASSRQAILDGEAFAAYTEGLSGYSDAMLDAARSNALAAGDSQKYNAVLSEQKSRAEEAAQAISDLVDQQIRGANSQYADTQGATDNAYRQTYGAGDVGLIRSLAAATGISVGRIRQDVQAALDDAKRFAPEAARIIERVYAEALEHRKTATVEQARVMEQAAKDEEDRIQRVLAGYVAATEARRVALEEAAAEEQRVNTLIHDSDVEASENRIRLIKSEQDAAADAAPDFEALARELAKQNRPMTDLIAMAEEYAKRTDVDTTAARNFLEGLKGVEVQAKRTSAALTEVSEARGTVRPPTLAQIQQFADPVTLGPSVPARGGLSDEQVKFQEEIYRTERVDAYRASLAKLTLEQLRSAQATALQNGQMEQHKLITAQIAETTKGVADGQRLIEQATRQLEKALGDTDGPWASQIASLEAMKKTAPGLTSQLDQLIAKFTELDEKAKRQKGLEDKINTFANYARQLVPVVTGAMETIGGVTSEVAGEWASDLGSMVNDVTNFALAIAKGDYVGAAIQALTSIFTWFSRNKKAAEDAAKATAEYNEQFKFSQNGYGTRTVETYTTGFLFWSTTHYREQIDQLGRDVALALDGGFQNGIKSGFESALAANDFSQFEKSLKTSVGQAVLEGLIEAFINKAIIAEKIGPAISEFLKTGDKDALKTAISGVVSEAEVFYNEVLKPIAEEFGLLGDSIGKAVDGSIAAKQEQLRKLQEKYNTVATQGERDALQKEIDRLNGEIKTMQGQAAAPAPAVATPTTTPGTIRLEGNTALAGVLNVDYLGTLTTSIGTLANLLPDFGRDIRTAGPQFAEAAVRLASTADRIERIYARLEATPSGDYR